MNVAIVWCWLFAVMAASCGSERDFPRFETVEIDPHVGEICYAVTVADVDGDQRQDIVAVSEKDVVWYANPTWSKRYIVRDSTDRDNV